jgi:hypothetical protein
LSWRRRLRPLVPARYRSQAIVDRWVERATGATVVAGPFAGMKYVVDPAALVLPKLLGSYERELAGVVEECIGAAYPLVVNAGAAEGYYAVGMARAHPRTRVIAFEADARRRELLEKIAALNGVNGRVDAAGACDRLALRRVLGQANGCRSPADSAMAPPPSRELALGQANGYVPPADNVMAPPPSPELALGQADGCLLIMDIEGGEGELLDPEDVPALAGCTILVELHPHAVPGVDEAVRARFTASHHIQEILSEPRRREDFPPIRVPLWLRLLFAEAMVNVMQERRPERMRWFYMRPCVP